MAAAGRPDRQRRFREYAPTCIADGTRRRGPRRAGGNAPSRRNPCDPSPVALYRLNEPDDLVEPTLIAAFDSWIDSGGASTAAASQLVDAGARNNPRSGAKSGKAPTDVV